MYRQYGQRFQKCNLSDHSCWFWILYISLLLFYCFCTVIFKWDIISYLLNTKSYFARPYCSNDKGTVENINGLIRRFFPKGTNFDNISEEAIAYVEDWINNRPMKILNYMTPNQKFQQCSVALAS